MPPETRSIRNTDRLLSYTFQSHKLTYLVSLVFQSTSASKGFLSLLSLWKMLHCVPERQYGCTATTYGQCHTQVIRPNYEDICATLIKRPVVLTQASSLVPSSAPVWVQMLMISPALQPHVCPCTVAASRLYSSHCSHTLPFRCWRLIWFHLHQEQLKLSAMTLFPVPWLQCVKHSSECVWYCLIGFSPLCFHLCKKKCVCAFLWPNIMPLQLFIR